MAESHIIKTREMTPSSAAGLAALGSQAGGFFKENDMENLDDKDKDEMFVYLDELRESGDINMYGACPHLAAEFDLDEQTAESVLMEWMEIFGYRHKGE